MILSFMQSSINNIRLTTHLMACCSWQQSLKFSPSWLWQFFLKSYAFSSSCEKNVTHKITGCISARFIRLNTRFVFSLILTARASISLILRKAPFPRDSTHHPQFVKISKRAQKMMSKLKCVSFGFKMFVFDFSKTILNWWRIAAF